MTFAVDIMHGHNPSNEMHYQLQPKSNRCLMCCTYITNKTEHDPCHQERDQRNKMRPRLPKNTIRL